MSGPQASSNRILVDVLVAVLFSVLVGIGAYRGSVAIHPIVFDKSSDDVWFESDQPRIFACMTNRFSEYHYRTNVHPLFSMAGFLPVYLARKGGHVEPATAVRIVSSVVAAAWAAMIFVVLRLFGCRRFDASLFATLAAVSATAVFGLVVPETFNFGSLTILLALGSVLVAQGRSLPSLWYVAMSAMTLGMTVTNWMAGIFATFASHPWKKSFQITVNAFCLVVVLWGAQKTLFPRAAFFIGDHVEDSDYINAPESGGPLSVARSFFFHTMVIPEIKVVDRYRSRQPDWPIMITQPSGPGSGTRWGIAAVGLWAALVVLGLWSLFRIAPHRPARVVLGLTLLGQLALHLVYGNETFLYGLHFAPLLVVLAALSTQTPARPVVLLLAGALVVAAAANNVTQFTKATSYLHSNASTKSAVGQPGRGHP
jgi:hypothetical protein